MNEFSRSKRLLKKVEYDQVFQQAKKIVSPHLIILYRSNDLTHARLGLALSKKMIAKAHDRTRVKRLIREIFRVTSALPAIDMIVLAKPGVAKMENAVITDGLKRALAKL